MKFEIEKSDLEHIASIVVEKLRPLLKASHSSRDTELLTVDELAVYLKMKKSTLYDKVHYRSIPFFKTGSSLRFRRKHIDTWLANPYHPDLDLYHLNHEGRRKVCGK